MFHPIINIILTFGLIVILLRKKVALSWSMVAGAVLLGILFKVPVREVIATVKRAVISPVFLQLGIALNIIMFLEHVLRTKGYLNKTVNALKVLIPNPKINMMILPAFLGLLPSPGGAIFSAPLVSEAGKEMELTPEDKSLLNYWFRHIWEYFIPLYPGIILASQILAVPLGKVSLNLAWFFLVAVGFGYLFYAARLKPISRKDPGSAPVVISRKQALLDLIGGIWPVLLIVLVVLIFRWDVGLTVSSVILFLLLINRYRVEDLKTLWKETFTMSLIYLIAGVLFFKEMLQSSGVVEWLPVYLKGLGIPDLLVTVCLPFFVAFSVGLSQAYVAATFPLLIGIIGSGPALNPTMLGLAYISGFVGIMLSPLHLCFLLTTDYYKANFVKVWQRLVPASLILLGVALLGALIWR